MLLPNSNVHGKEIRRKWFPTSSYLCPQHEILHLPFKERRQLFVEGLEGIISLQVNFL